MPHAEHGEPNSRRSRSRERAKGCGSGASPSAERSRGITPAASASISSLVAPAHRRLAPASHPNASNAAARYTHRGAPRISGSTSTPLSPSSANPFGAAASASVPAGAASSSADGEDAQRKAALSRRADEPAYAYVDVQRGRQAREQLRGFECTSCAAFYAAVTDNSVARLQALLASRSDIDVASLGLSPRLASAVLSVARLRAGGTSGSTAPGSRRPIGHADLSSALDCGHRLQVVPGKAKEPSVERVAGTAAGIPSGRRQAGGAAHASSGAGAASSTFAVIPAVHGTVGQTYLQFSRGAAGPCPATLMKPSAPVAHVAVAGNRRGPEAGSGAAVRATEAAGQARVPLPTLPMAAQQWPPPAPSSVSREVHAQASFPRPQHPSSAHGAGASVPTSVSAATTASAAITASSACNASSNGQQWTGRESGQQWTGQESGGATTSFAPSAAVAMSADAPAFVAAVGGWRQLPDNAARSNPPAPPTVGRWAPGGAAGHTTAAPAAANSVASRPVASRVMQLAPRVMQLAPPQGGGGQTLPAATGAPPPSVVAPGPRASVTSASAVAAAPASRPAPPPPAPRLQPSLRTVSSRHRGVHSPPRTPPGYWDCETADFRLSPSAKRGPSWATEDRQQQ